MDVEDTDPWHTWLLSVYLNRGSRVCKQCNVLNIMYIHAWYGVRLHTKVVYRDCNKWKHVVDKIARKRITDSRSTKVHHTERTVE